MSALATELHYLRRRLGAPLPELVAEVERAMGLDVEVAASPARAGFGRVHLDRFLDETARFAAESDEATLRAFLAFLEAAEKEENGLELGEIVVESERVGFGEGRSKKAAEQVAAEQALRALGG